MPTAEAVCPACEGNLPLHGDEKVGDEVYCSYCGVMSTVVACAGGVCTLEAQI